MEITEGFKMIVYLQLMEQLTPEEGETKIPRRLEIEVENENDAIDKYNDTYKAMFIGTNFDAQILYHTPLSEGADTVEPIEQVRLE